MVKVDECDIGGEGGEVGGGLVFGHHDISLVSKEETGVIPQPLFCWFVAWSRTPLNL